MTSIPHDPRGEQGLDEPRVAEFKGSDEVLPRARSVIGREQERLAELAPDAILEFTGGSSLPGGLTSGDIDLHLRVPPGSFSATVEALGHVYDVVHPEIWSATLATFTVRGDGQVGVAVTPVGSEHDRRFVRAWQRLRTEPELVDAYLDLKRRHAGGDRAAYTAAKSEFFNALDADEL